MASRPINVTIKGDYTDRDIKRAMRDLGSLQRQGPRTSKSLRGLGTGFAIAGAAAAAFAAKIGIDAVRAAMDEQQELNKLNTTLKNLGFGAASDQVNQFIDDLQYVTTFTDSDMRPAFQKLAVATGSVTKAQAAMRTTLDLATHSNSTAEQAATALAKAFGGNTKSLKTLVPGMDATILKSGDMNKIMGELARIVGGQAAAAADTMGGKMQILANGVGELQESFGQGIMEGFLDALTGGSNDVEDMKDAMRNAQDTLINLGKTLGQVAGWALQFMENLGLFSMQVVATIDDAWRLQERAAINLRDALGLITDEEADAQRAALDAADAASDQAIENYRLSLVTDDTTASLEDATQAAVDYGDGLDEAATKAAKLERSQKTLQRQMDRMAKNRSIASQRISLARQRQEGPQKSGERTEYYIDKNGNKKKRTVRFSTRMDLREFGLDYMGDAQALATEIAERGGMTDKAKARASKVIERARRFLARKKLGRAFTRENGRFGGTPEELYPGGNREGWVPINPEDLPGGWNPLNPNATPPTNTWSDTVTIPPGQGGTTITIEKVEVTAETAAQAMQQAKQWIRLAAAGRGPATDGSRPDVRGTTRRPPGGAGG